MAPHRVIRVVLFWEGLSSPHQHLPCNLPEWLLTGSLNPGSEAVCSAYIYSELIFISKKKNLLDCFVHLAISAA
jgi:hypothetical protein